MHHKKATYHIRSRILTSFLSIPQNKYLQKIHYFEKKEDQIQQLPSTEQYLLYTLYADALYNLSVFTKYLAYNHQVLAMSLNPQLEEDNNVFKTLLSRKASALYRLGNYQESIYICKELLKMDYQKNYISRLFVKSQKRIERDKDHRFKAMLILLISALSVIYFIQSIFLSAFYPDLNKYFNLVLVGITGIIVVQIIWHERKIMTHARKALKIFMTEFQ